jgi:hypothetical protein
MSCEALKAIIEGMLLKKAVSFSDTLSDSIINARKVQLEFQQSSIESILKLLLKLFSIRYHHLLNEAFDVQSLISVSFHPLYLP